MQLLKQKSENHFHNSRASVKVKGTELIAELDKAVVANACQRFHSCANHAVKTENSFFK